MVNFDFKKNFEIDDASLINFVHLSPPQKEMVLTWRNSERIRKWMYTDHVISKDEHQKFLVDLENNNNAFYWLVKMWNNYIGVVYFLRVGFRNRNTYFGIYANPQSKILGVGIKLDMLAIRLAFDYAGFHSLKLEVIEDNKHVIELHKKMGFVEEGKLKDFVLKDNIWKNVVVMGITNKEK